MMRDRNPAAPSHVCPKCGEVAFRMGIHTYFVQHWGCYCEACGYQTELSPSEIHGCQPWMDAPEAPPATEEEASHE